MGQLSSGLRIEDENLLLPDSEGDALELLRRKLEDKGLSQKECAQRVGVSYSHLNRIINGKRKLSLPTATKIASVLDIKVTRFYTGVNPISPGMAQAIKDIRLQIITYFEKHPEYLYDLSDREFEEFIAEHLTDIGCHVDLTRKTRDGGRDILAGFPTSAGYILSIVDCKRSSDRLMDPYILHRLLTTVVSRYRGSCEILTTAYFSTIGSIEIEKDYLWKIRLRDYKKLRKWIGGYGRWTRTGPSELWLSDYGHSE
jgi:transcriptional regulator with XRE-family HTH domain